jgi:predicted transcriptional regulator
MDFPPLPRLALDIINAYGARQPLASADLGPLIEAITKVLTGLGAAAVVPLAPAVPIHRSIAPDYIVCLEDGRKGKLLKGYLRRVFQMSPDQYRKKWGLPRDYPMVAPSYAKWRSQQARRIGLGRPAPVKVAVSIAEPTAPSRSSV